MSELASIPDARPANSVYVEVSGGQRRTACQPVVFREGGRWRVGVVVQWIRALDSPWMAQIRTVEPGSVGADLKVFDYLGDGAIMLLRLVEVEGIPVLRPVAPKGPDGGRETRAG